ncbi:MAG TPA: septum formation initiator family protein [Actinomycetota bacterium]|nr:septum formation initiator family protein [Actinomycetota bacterium]
MTTTTPIERAQRAIMTPRGAILALLLVGVLFSSVYPIRRYFQVRSSIAQLQHEERALDQKTLQLQQQKQLLQSDAEVERIAREDLGMARPGEVPFVIIQPTPAPTATANVSAAGLFDPTPTSKPGFFARIWNAFVRAAHTIR